MTASRPESAQDEVVEGPTAADFPCATPGPWRECMSSAGDGDDPIYRTISGGDGFGLAELGMRGFSLSGFIHPADARLMAAAPELLSALRAFASAARSWHDFHHGSKHIACDAICDALPAAEAAIAKASQQHPSATQENP